MESTKDMKTRSQASLADYIPMNNQKRPIVGNIVNVRIKPSKQHNNIQTHGWVTICIKACYEIKPKEEEGTDYLITGNILSTNKSISARLKWRTEDDSVDVRLRQGWDIDQDDNEIHEQRLKNSQHMDNKTILQDTLTDLEFTQITGMTATPSQNLYEIPRTPSPLARIQNRLTIEDDIPSSRPRLRRREKSPSAPPALVTPRQLSFSDYMDMNSDTSRSGDDSDESLIWTISDYKYTKILNKSLEDNLLTIIERYNKKLIRDVNGLSQALISEQKLIKQTNKMEGQLRTIDWIYGTPAIEEYIQQRKKWFNYASRYKQDRDRVLYGIRENIRAIPNLPGLGRNLKGLLCELEDTQEENEFINILKQISKRMMRLDTLVDQQDSEYSGQLPSMTSIFDFVDPTPYMNDRAVAQFSDEELGGMNKNKHTVDDKHEQEEILVTDKIEEHPALKDLGKFEQRRNNTDLTVYTLGNDNHGAPAPKIPIGLSDLLKDEAMDLLEHATNISTDITRNLSEIGDTLPNKHTEDTLRDFERKVEKISEGRMTISNKYGDYVMKYNHENSLDEVRNICSHITNVLKQIRSEVENFRTKAAPKVGHEEITYARLKDTNAPKLNINSFDGESSLAVYLEWIHQNKRLPSNLLNTKLAKTLPPLVHSRLSQQHPESSRTVEEVIIFLLKTYGRTAKIEEQLRTYHSEVGTLNSLMISGHAMNPYNCKEVITTADKHLVGLRSIETLKRICISYLGINETKLWFQEYLHTHGFCSWLASNILTMIQVSLFAELPLSTGEEKITWIIDQVEELRSKADRMISSGVADSMHTTCTTRPVLLTSNIDASSTTVKKADNTQNPSDMVNKAHTSSSLMNTWNPTTTQPNNHGVPLSTPTKSWNHQTSYNNNNGIPAPKIQPSVWKQPTGLQPQERQSWNKQHNLRPTSSPAARLHIPVSSNTQQRSLTQVVVRSTAFPDQYNAWLSRIFKEAFTHNCHQRINCAAADTVTYKETWFQSRKWFLLENIRINNGQDYISLLDLPKYSNLCGAQRRRISYLLGSPNHCLICSKHLVNTTDLLPLPHYMFTNTSTEHNFITDKCKTINWPLGCPQILKENDPILKLKELIHKGNIQGCPASCNLQYTNIYQPGDSPIDKCKAIRCQGVDPTKVIGKLQVEFKEIIKQNEVDFTSSSGKVLILASIYSAIKRKSNMDNEGSRTQKQLLYGTKGELFEALNISPVKVRTSRFVFIHYNIQSQNGDQSLIKVFQDTCCSSTAMRNAIAGNKIAGANAGHVNLEVTGSKYTREKTLDFVLNHQKDQNHTHQINNAIIMDDIIRTQEIIDTKASVMRLLDEMKILCEESDIIYDIHEENIPIQFGGQLDLLIGNSVFELDRLFTSSFGLSLYEVPLKINGKRSYAIGGYLDEEIDFRTPPELFIKKIGKTNSTKEITRQDSLNIDYQQVHGTRNSNTLHNHQTVLITTTDIQKLNYSIHELKLPKLNDDFSLHNYLNFLRLEEFNKDSIDTSGSCGYDSIWKGIQSLKSTIPERILELLEPNARFPLRELCKKLLQLSPTGTPWEDMYDLFKEETKNQLTLTKVNITEALVLNEAKNNWESQANGTKWIDTYILRLIALAMDFNMIIFQDQPTSTRKFNMTTLSGGIMSTAKKPIMLLLSNSHYTPLKDNSTNNTWFRLCTNNETPPWDPEITLHDHTMLLKTSNKTDHISPKSNGITSIESEWAPVTPTNDESWTLVTRHDRKSSTKTKDHLINIEMNNKTVAADIYLDSMKGGSEHYTSSNYWDPLQMNDLQIVDAQKSTPIQRQNEPPNYTQINNQSCTMKDDTQIPTGIKNLYHEEEMNLQTPISPIQYNCNAYKQQPSSIHSPIESTQQLTEDIYHPDDIYRSDDEEESEVITNIDPVLNEQTPNKRKVPQLMENIYHLDDIYRSDDEEESEVITNIDPTLNEQTPYKKEDPQLMENFYHNNDIYKSDDEEESETITNLHPAVTEKTSYKREVNQDSPTLDTINHSTLSSTYNPCCKERQRPISDLTLQAKLFDENYDIRSRCDTCRICKRCSPFITISVKEKENITKNEENILIRKYMSIENKIDTQKKIIVTKMPCSQDRLDISLTGSNRQEVVYANDRKLKQLTVGQQSEIWEEFQKLVKMGYIVEVTTLSDMTQAKLKAAIATYYIAVAPAFKSTSSSTKCRCAFDASMKNRSTKCSLNECLPTGFTGISLTATFRRFRLYPVGMACDLKKYYNSIQVHPDSYAVNRIVFRDKANPTGELREYVLHNLFYGIKPAGSITDEAIKYIAREALLKCGTCNSRLGKDHSTNPNKGTCTPITIQKIPDEFINNNCNEVHHEVYKLLQEKYVDDILHSTYTHERVEEIKEFLEQELNDYSFATKGYNVSGDDRTPGDNNLNEDNKLGTCSYLWDPYTDKFKPKEILLHNGVRFRGAIKPMKDWVTTTPFGKYYTVKAPSLKTIVFKTIDEISFEKIEDLWHNTPQTLRSGLSKVYMLFEPCGYLAPLAGQTRAALHEIVKLNGNVMEKNVPNIQWKHLLICIVEQLKAMTYEYDRRPDKLYIDDTCENHLFTFTDYGANICVVSYLVTITVQGRSSAIILHAKTMNRQRTIPKGELDALCEGSIQHRMLLTELGDVISKDFLFTDSTICIYQLLSEKHNHENIFVNNRLREIRNNIDVINKIYFVKSQENCADIGTRYGTSTNNTKFLTHEMVGPTSPFAVGKPWFNNLQEAEALGLISPSRSFHDAKRSSKTDEIDHILINFGVPDTPSDTHDHDTYTNENLWEEYYSDTGDNKVYVTIPCRCTCTCSDRCEQSCQGCRDNTQNTIQSQTATDEDSDDIDKSVKHITTKNSGKDQGVHQNMLTITQIHNKRHNEDTISEILNEVQTRYWYPGQSETIKGLQYLNSLKQETFRPFVKNFRMTRIVIKACIAFLRHIRRDLVLISQYHQDFKYLTLDAEEPCLKHGKLSNSSASRQNHKSIINYCNNLFGTPENNITNIKCSTNSILQRNDLNCLRGSHCGQNLLSEKYKFWSHHDTRRTIRLLSQLYNIVTSVISKHDEEKFTRIWTIICDLLMLHTYEMKTKTLLSNFVVQDITTCLTFLVRRDKIEEVKKGFINNTKGNLQWLKGINNFFIHEQEDLPSRNNITKLMIFDYEDYQNATNAAAALYGIKINSETKEFAKERDLKKFAIKKDNHWIANKRSSNLGNYTQDPDVEKLLMDYGVGHCSLYHEVFSPTSWSILKYLHLPDPSTKVLERKSFSHIPEHLGRPRLLSLAQKKYYIAKASRLIDMVITLCPQCNLRNKQVEPSPQGRIPTFLLKSSPRPYTCTHLDLAGPIQILTETGHITTRNQQQVSAYILVAVCSLTKHSTMLLLNSTGTKSVSLALSALMRKVGQPSLLITDSQSSFTKLMKENSLVIHNEEVLEILSIPIRLVPVGNAGHTHAGSVEKRIDLLRRLIGNFNFTKTSLAISDFQNILDVAVGAINKTPIGIRRANKALQDIATSSLVKYISPETLYNPRLAPQPTSFISITKDVDNYITTNEKLNNFITTLMYDYLIEIQNQGINSCEDFTLLQEGDIVSFKTKDFLHHHYHHDFTFGRIHSIHPDPIDGIVRTVKVSYLARPGEKIFIDDSIVTLTKGLHCITTRPVKTLIKICGKNDLEETFRQDAERTEVWLNTQHQNQQIAEPVQKLPWKPSQLIYSRLQPGCTQEVQQIQQTLIENDSIKSRLKVPVSKLHLTHLVMKDNDQSMKMFSEASEYIKNSHKEIKYTIGSLDSYNGNLVLTLMSDILPEIQNTLMRMCEKYHIAYDKQQTYHITIFKKDHMSDTTPLLKDALKKLSEGLIPHNKIFNIDNVVLGKIDKGLPPISTFFFTQRSQEIQIENVKDNKCPSNKNLMPKTNLSSNMIIHNKSKDRHPTPEEIHKRSLTAQENEPDLQVVINQVHPNNNIDTTLTPRIQLTQQDAQIIPLQPTVTKKNRDIRPGIDNTYATYQTRSIKRTQSDTETNKYQKKLIVSYKEPESNILDKKSKAHAHTMDLIDYSTMNNMKKQKSLYTTTIMNQLSRNIILMAILILSVNAAAGNVMNDNKTLPLKEYQLSSQEEHNHHPQNHIREKVAEDSQLITLYPLLTMIMIILVIAMDVVYAIINYKRNKRKLDSQNMKKIFRHTIKPTCSVEILGQSNTKKESMRSIREQVTDIKDDKSATNFTNITHERQLVEPNKKRNNNRNNSIKDPKQKTITTHQASPQSPPHPQYNKFYIKQTQKITLKSSWLIITIISISLQFETVSAGLEDQISLLKDRIDELVKEQSTSKSTIKDMHENYLNYYHLETDRGWDAKQIDWLPSKLSSIATIIHQAIVMETNAKSNMRKIIQDNTISSINVIKKGAKMLQRRNKRNAFNNQKHNDHYTQMRRHSKHVKLRNDHINTKDYIEQVNALFDTDVNTDSLDSRKNHPPTDARMRFDGNLEDLRPIKILMGMSDTTDVRSMKADWMRKASNLPKLETEKTSHSNDQVKEIIRTSRTDQLEMVPIVIEKQTQPPIHSSTQLIEESGIRGHTNNENIHDKVYGISEQDEITQTPSVVDTTKDVTKLNTQDTLPMNDDKTLGPPLTIPDTSNQPPTLPKKPVNNVDCKKIPDNFTIFLKSDLPPSQLLAVLKSDSPLTWKEIIYTTISKAMYLIRDLRCDILDKTQKIKETNYNDDLSIKNSTDTILQTTLEKIVEHKEKINETLHRINLASTFIDEGMNIWTMEVAEKHRIMGALLQKTGAIIERTMASEVHLLLRQGRDKRGAPLHRNKRDMSESTITGSMTTKTLNTIDNTGVLPKDVTTGLKILNTAKNTINNITGAIEILGSGIKKSLEETEGDAFEESIMLLVASDDRIRNKQTITTPEGETSELYCFTDNELTTDSEIIWKRSDNALLPDYSYKLKSNNLHIEATKCSHAGEYQCGLNNGQPWDNFNIGVIWNLFEIKVICTDESVMKITPTIIVGTEGETITLKCGSPEHTEVLWKKTSGINKDSVSGEDTSLIIQKATTNDAGIYTCSYKTQHENETTTEQFVLQIRVHTTDGSNTPDDLGFLEAYDCTKQLIKKTSIDLTQTGNCNKTDYMAYEPAQPTIIELIHHKTAAEITVNACQLTIHLLTAYCRPGNMLSIWAGIFNFISPETGGGHGIDGFITQLIEDYTISEDACRSAWRTGELKIDLGKQHVKITVPKGKPSNTRSNIYLHESKYTQFYNCTPVYGWKKTGPVYRGQDDPKSAKRSHEVVRAELTLTMKQVFALVDKSEGKLYIPSAGREVDLKTMPQEYSTNSPTVGTIVILKGDLPLDECKQHFHIAGGTADLYKPTNQEHENVPQLVRFETEVQSDIRVFGFQLVKTTKMCEVSCHLTQFKGIILCIRNTESEFINSKNVKILNDLGSNSLGLLQVNIDKSIQNLMLHLCLLNQKHILSAMKDIELYGPSLIQPVNNGRGLKLLQRGEQGIIVECPKATAIPRSEENDICCNNFPISVMQKGGKTSDRYLQSITRQVVDLCDPVPCSEIMPIKIRTISGNSVCQLKGHITQCNNPTMLEPKNDVTGNLDLLSTSEQKLSTIVGSLPGQIEVWNIISTMKLKSADDLLGKITQQGVRCAGNYCESDPITEDFRRKFARASLPSDVHYFSFSYFLKFMMITTVVLFWYEKLTALLTVVVSFHACCKDRNKSFQNVTLCGIIMESFCLFSKSCNPLHPKSLHDEIEFTRIKRKIRNIKENSDVFIEEQTGLLEDISMHTLRTNHETENDTLTQLTMTITKQQLEIENLQRILEDITIKKKKKKNTSNHSKPNKYPAIFSTPPTQKRNIGKHVTFSIEDTEKKKKKIWSKDNLILIAD